MPYMKSLNGYEVFDETARAIAESAFRPGADSTALATNADLSTLAEGDYAAATAAIAASLLNAPTTVPFRLIVTKMPEVNGSAARFYYVTSADNKVYTSYRVGSSSSLDWREVSNTELSDNVSALEETVYGGTAATTIEGDYDVTTGKYITATGTQTNNSNSGASDFIPVLPGETVTIEGVRLDGVRKLCGYSASNESSFVSPVLAENLEVTESTVTIVIPDNVNYIRTTTDKATTSVHVTRVSPARKESKIKYVAEMMARMGSGKTVHFSFDDTWQPLYTLQSTNPASIWDVTEFAALKQIHEETGACFTMNLFNTSTSQSSYDISRVPSTWTSEFTAAKDWLKFAFHGENENADYSTLTTAADDYAKFVTAVKRFTGSEECIDRVTRLGFFGGTKEQITAMKNAECGITGLLCADSAGRTSYDLDSESESFVSRYGWLYSAEDDIVFIKSFTRLDSAMSAALIDEIKAGFGVNDKYVEVFAHTLSDNIKTRIRQICAWADAHGYQYGYFGLAKDADNDWLQKLRSAAFLPAAPGTEIEEGDLRTLKIGQYFCNGAGNAKKIHGSPLSGSYRLLIAQRSAEKYINLTAWGNDGNIYTATYDSSVTRIPEDDNYKWPEISWASTGRFTELAQRVDGLSAQVDALAATVAGKIQTDFDTVRKNVNRGWGRAFYPVGSELSCWKAFDATAAAGAMNTGVTGATVDFEVWLTAVDKIDPAPRVFKYTGSKWQLNGTNATLADYGITATGTPAADDTITVTMDCVELVWRVVAHDHHQTADNAEHTMTLEMKYIYGTANAATAIQFDWSEAFYTVEGSAMPAGTYTFTVPETMSNWTTGDYSFTTTQSHPVGAQLCISYTYTTTMTSAKVQIFDGGFRDNTAAEECSITAGASGTALGTMGSELNSAHRVSVGSNNYAQSNIRQWLNSTDASGHTLTAQTKYDRPAPFESNGGVTYAGFLHGIDKVFANALATAVVPCVTNNIFETNSLDGTVFTPNLTYTLYDKVFLLSMKEIYGEATTYTDGELLDYYNGLTDTEKIKYDSMSNARTCCLRSAYHNDPRRIRLMYITGAQNSGNALSTAYNCPAVVIGGAGSAE